MAYNLGDRFNPDPKPFNLLDPGAYQLNRTFKLKQNAAPFLSNTPRKTQAGARIWTDAIYESYNPDRIPNCTALMSKRPRFPYEALSKEDLDDLLCRCGLNVCDCPSENEEPEISCQAKVPRRLFKGQPPRSHFGNGLSAPSKNDQGFDVGVDGSVKRLRKKISNQNPPFYDSRVNEFTAFYRGCKWSKWTGRRSGEQYKPTPGPADYYFVRDPTEFEKCVEKLREYRRKTSKQLRFIEMIQQRNLTDASPGPGTYSPETPKGTDLQHLGANTERFQESTEQSPGPADYMVKRSFEPPERPSQPCHCKLPAPAFFGVKALRFKPLKEEGPSPATYNPNDKLCQYMQCRTAPFGSSSVRFKEKTKKLDDDDDDEDLEDVMEECDDEVMRVCPLPTSGFKSKTIRMHPLVTKFNEPSPADFPQPNNTAKRSSQFQYMAPFFSSEGRFQPWYDWMPVFNKFNTPGPCYYNLEKPRCLPAVRCGPLVRSERFPQDIFQTPAPNEYKIGGGVDTVLKTHNRKLRHNMQNKYKFHWEPPLETRKLTYQEKESLLWNKSIKLLDNDDAEKRKSRQQEENKLQPKLLRCFLYNKQFPPC